MLVCLVVISICEPDEPVELLRAFLEQPDVSSSCKHAGGKACLDTDNLQLLERHYLHYSRRTVMALIILRKKLHPARGLHIVVRNV